MYRSARVPERCEMDSWQLLKKTRRMWWVSRVFQPVAHSGRSRAQSGRNRCKLPASGGVFRAIDPGFWRPFRADINRLEGDRRIIGAVKSFRAFLADEYTPSGIASVAEKKNRVMRRLRARGSLRGLGHFGGLLGRFCGLLRQGSVNRKADAQEERACQAE